MLTQLCNYWQISLTLLFKKSIALKNNFIKFPIEQLVLGRIPNFEQADPLHEIKAKQQLVAVAPYCISNKSKLLLPLFLLANLDNKGNLHPYNLQPLPWLAHDFVEPFVKSDFALTNSNQVEQAYAILPPNWEQNPSTWQEQINYALKFLNYVTGNSWQNNCRKSGYFIEKYSLAIPLATIDQNFDPELYQLKFLIKGLKKKQKLFTLKTEAKAEPTDAISVQNTSFCHTSRKYSLTSEQRKIIAYCLQDNNTKAIFVESIGTTGKNTVINNIVATLYTVAAILGTKEPYCFKIKNNKIIRTSILDAPSTAITQETIKEDPEILLAEIKRCFDLQQKCMKAKNKYLSNLEKQDPKSHAETLLLEKQAKETELENTIKIIKDIRDLQKKYKAFIASHPECKKPQVYAETLNNSHSDVFYAMLQAQEQLIDELEIFELETLFNCELEILEAEQEKITKETIYIQHNIDTINKLNYYYEHEINTILKHRIKVTSLEDYLDTSIRHELFILTQKYWRKKCDLQKEESQQTTVKYSDILNQENSFVFILNAENLNAIYSHALLTSDNRQLIFGNSFANVPKKIPLSIANNLFDKLILPEEYDHEYFNPCEHEIIAKGNMAEILSLHADKTFSLKDVFHINPAFIKCYSALNNTTSPTNQPITKDSAITLYPVRCYHEKIAGSYKNSKEIAAILEWLTKKQKYIQAQYANSNYNAISIVTTYFGQMAALTKALIMLDMPNVKVSLIQTTMQEKSHITIFSPVYHCSDKADLCFDQGTFMLQQILLNTIDHILLFADDRIFDSSKHSPSGVFAKYIKTMELDVVSS